MEDLKYIKKHYGEKMMHLCRNLFPTILEEPGKLSIIIELYFNHSRNLYYDIKENKLEDSFKKFIYKKYNNEGEILKSSTKTPSELLEEVDYKLYECNTEEDIQKFKKYYKQDEQLCTFLGGRLKTCYVFFAVRKNADILKRERFNKPRREDEYGISVISIQFSKKDYTLSIKNRYNQSVINPDATYGNNLESIIPGLTISFQRYLGCKIKQNEEDNFEIPNYIKIDGKFYKYNYEMNNTYYCINNIIIKNGKIKEYPHEQYIIMDYYILNIKNKTLTTLDDIQDGFIEEYKNIERIEIRKEKTKKIIKITTQNNIKSIIVVNNQNQIIEYENNNIRKLKPYFMLKNKTLKKIKIQNIRTMENHCFYSNVLEELNAPNLQRIGDYCFCHSELLEKLYIPNVQVIGHYCFYDTNSLKELTDTNLQAIGNYCFYDIESLEELNATNLQIIGNHCFYNAQSLKRLNAPKLISTGDQCFVFTKTLNDSKTISNNYSRIKQK